MKNYFLILLALLIGAQWTYAVDKVTVTGGIYSRTTSKYVVGANVAILTKDSALLSEGKAEKETWRLERDNIYYRDTIGIYSLEFEKNSDDFILRVIKDGYEPKFVNFTLKNMGAREFKKELPNVYLSPERESVDLDEVVVQATKVKFYNKGDTIVYNADAFMLPEGSMLDALISQMPGVEIRDGGQIYVNGKYVESLMLNGKDFFKGKNEVMLENIGVYTVKDVAVYEKSGNIAELLKADMKEDKKLVMDVRLKKEYMAGTLLNIEAGYGTDDRYLGRLFTMLYTNNLRLTAYGNFNNINNMRRPGNGNGSNVYASRDNLSGLTDVTNGGVDYSYDNPLHTFEATGNVDVSYRKNRTNHDMIRFNYLPEGDTYDYEYSRSLSRRFSISTDHSFKIKKQMWNLTMNPKFSYSNEHTDRNSIAASFTQELKDANDEVLRNLYTGSYRDLQKSIINRNRLETENRQHGLKTGIWCENSYKIKGSPDGFTFWFETNYTRDTPDGKTLQAIDFGEKPNSSILSQRNNQDHPQYTYMVRGSGRYFLNMNSGTFSIGAYYQHDQQRKNSDLFMMEARSEDGEAEFLPDQIPELDYANSYTSMLYENSVFIMPRWDFHKKGSKGSFNLYTRASLVYDHRHLYYNRGSVNADPSKSLFYFKEGGANVEYSSANNKLQTSLAYIYSTKLADLVDMVDIVNDTDPLNIQLGNPDLKTQSEHSVFINANYSMPANARLWFYGGLSIYDNQIVRGYRYDTTTGIRTFKSYNVNGSSNLNLYLNYSRDLWMKGFSGGVSVNYTRNRYADMVGENSEPVKQQVLNQSYSCSVNLGYHHGIFDARIHTNLRWGRDNYQRLNSVSNTFNTYNSASINLELPKNFSIGTDLNFLTRDGYLENQMNSHDWIWNAQVSYKLKNAWTFSVRGYDILNQIKNVQYVVNAQGRTQEMYNILPRFVMLTVKYNFDFKPKKHK